MSEHDLKYRRRKPDNTGPRGSGRTYRILEICVALAEQGQNIVFVYGGALGHSWHICLKIKEPDQTIHSMRKLVYGEGSIIFTPQIRREVLIGTDRKVVLDHVYEWT